MRPVSPVGLPPRDEDDELDEVNEFEMVNPLGCGHKSTAFRWGTNEHPPSAGVSVDDTGPVGMCRIVGVAMLQHHDTEVLGTVSDPPFCLYNGLIIHQMLL